MPPCDVELIGCGALAEQVYAPVLSRLERAGRIRVTALLDPTSARRACLARVFSSARAVEKITDLPTTDGALAIVASPPTFHAEQTRALLAAGRHVLCEKPLAMSVAEAESMIAAAHAANRLLAAGMMRRFYPAAQALREAIAAEVLGQIHRMEVAEGGRFSWSAASPKFFAPAQGGVLFDLGSHVLDLLCHWFGEPASTSALLDTAGGTNTNALLAGRWAGHLEARVHLSWDTPINSGWRLLATRGEWRWDGSPDGPLLMRPACAKWRWHAEPQADGPTGSGWLACFARQVDNVLDAIAGRAALLASAENVLPSLRWLENTRRQARPWPQGWLSPEEQAEATRLAQS
jgi:predicted dehydrogenase